jgi:hypothetical protein
VIRHQGRLLQLQPGQRRYGPTQSKGLVCEWEDGTTEVYYRGQRMAVTELREPLQKPSPPLLLAARAILVRKAKKDHLWRQLYKNMKSRLPNQGTRQHQKRDISNKLTMGTFLISIDSPDRSGQIRNEQDPE